MSFFLFLSLSLSQANSLEYRSPLSSLSCLGLQDPCERVPCAYVKQCKPCVKGFIGFLCKPRNISLSLSLFYFLIVDSRPPGSSPFRSNQSLSRVQSIKGPQLVAPRTGTWYTWQIRTEWLKALLRWVSTKTWAKWLESPITFLLYFIT